MHKSKLLYLLGGLTKKEIRELEYYIDSPAFNKDETVKPLYQQVIRYYPEFDSKRLQKENMAIRLYGDDKVTSMKKLAYSMSNFAKLVDKYILLKELDEQDDDRDFLKMKAYKRRNLDKSFFRTGEIFNQRLDKLPYRDMEYFRLKYMLNGMIAAHEGVAKHDKDVESIRLWIENLELYFLNAKLFQFRIILNREKITQEKFEFVLFNQILDTIKNKPYDKIPSIQINYYSLYNRFGIDSLTIKENYYSLKEMFFQNYEIFKKEEKEELFNIFINYTDFLNKTLGFDEFINERYAIYQKGFSDKVFFIDGFLMVTSFYNYTQLGCELGKVDIIERDFFDYKTFVRKNEYEMFEKLCLSYIFLSRKNYEKVLITLRDAKPRNFFQDWSIRGIKLMTYFEMNEEILVYNYIESFEAFVRRHKKLSVIRKEKLLNFLKFVNKLSKNKYSNKYTTSSLSNELNQMKNISYKLWLKRMVIESNTSLKPM